MTPLSFDTCRCYGERLLTTWVVAYICPVRSNCARYQQSDKNLGPRTAIADLYCHSGNLTGFIDGEKA